MGEFPLMLKDTRPLAFYVCVVLCSYRGHFVIGPQLALTLRFKLALPIALHHMIIWHRRNRLDPCYPPPRQCGLLRFEIDFNRVTREVTSVTYIRLGPLGGVLAVALTCSLPSMCLADDFFRNQVAPILERHCVSCHIGDDAKGKLSLETAASVTAGGDSGPPIVPGNLEDSYLLEVISGDKPQMPKNAPPLSKAQVEILRRWVKEGAVWPEGIELKNRQFEGQTWWSLEKLARPAVPQFGDTAPQAKWGRNAIDAFIAQEHVKHGLEPAPEANRRTLIRRLSFDLTGLPPTPAEIDAFVNSQDPRAYELLVDRLLDSPAYGERWARHWLDVVHYGDTHGYDKDKPRPFAWPYRDYVIRALNSDKPYSRFVQEQVAGDVLFPGTVDGTEALGFIAAGPWDYIGHAEVPESKTDGKIARHLDRHDREHDWHVQQSDRAMCTMS
jgi:hypothetical protein